MKVKIDKQANAAYIYFQDFSSEKTIGVVKKTLPIENEPNINVDFTEDNKIFGIEILDLGYLDLTQFKIEDFL